ncbi:MAG: prepilin-type N-terminal cleavage/methylation domain-containing protein [Sulfurovum sp.]|nr:prepilin-type N-terminal cleavage/methylation domain-containing protein [Sulfurovum sp.]
MKKAFTMIELVFVIVIIGILSAIAVPKFAATRDDALISKGRAEVAALRSAIATERQKRILRGDFDNITASEAVGLLEYGLSSKWSGLTFTGPSGATCAFSVETSEKNKLVKGTCGVSGMSDL